MYFSQIFPSFLFLIDISDYVSRHLNCNMVEVVVHCHFLVWRVLEHFFYFIFFIFYFIIFSFSALSMSAARKLRVWIFWQELLRVQTSLFLFSLSSLKIVGLLLIERFLRLERFCYLNIYIFIYNTDNIMYN